MDARFGKRATLFAVLALVLLASSFLFGEDVREVVLRGFLYAVVLSVCGILAYWLQRITFGVVAAQSVVRVFVIGIVLTGVAFFLAFLFMFVMAVAWGGGSASSLWLIISLIVALGLVIAVLGVFVRKVWTYKSLVAARIAGILWSAALFAVALQNAWSLEGVLLRVFETIILLPLAAAALTWMIFQNASIVALFTQNADKPVIGGKK